MNSLPQATVNIDKGLEKIVSELNNDSSVKKDNKETVALYLKRENTEKNWECTNFLNSNMA